VGTLALASFCIGAAVGLRLRVSALIYLIFFCLMVITTWGFALAQTGWSIILMNSVGAIGLQLGYFGGTLPRLLINAARIDRADDPRPVGPFAR
jgi:hypothetical protein